MKSGKNTGLIVFTLAHLGVGGAQKVASLIMNKLIELGYEVAVCCYYPVKEHVGLSDKVKRVYLFNNAAEYEVSGFQRVPVKLKAIARYRTVLREINPLCIVSFGPDPLLFPACKLMRYEGKLVCCERGDANQRNIVYKIITEAEMASSDRGVFQFDGAMAPYGRSLPDDTRVIPNPCEKNLSTARDSGQLNNEIVGAGRLVPDKGFDTLIKAFSMIVDMHNVNLVIYGEGPDRERLENLIEVLGIKDRVSMPGSVPNIAERAQRARLFVLASQYEGCPNTLIEAMCAGVPVVASDCSPGGARFLTNNGTVGGPLVPIDDSDSMAIAISWMLDNFEKAESLGKAGASLVEAYPMDRVMDMWADLFIDLLGAPKLTRKDTGN